MVRIAVVALLPFFLSFQMTSCECSICFDDINASTGMTTLSCGHTFHFNCVVKWFMNQERDAPSSCALCRKQMTPTEDLPLLEENDISDEESESDSSSDSSSEWSSDSDDNTEVDSEVDPTDIQHRVDTLKLRLSNMDESAAKLFAAGKIQAVARGYFVRQQTDRVKYMRSYMKKMERRINHVKMLLRIQTSALRMGKVAWNSHVASTIQALWRGFRVRKQRSGKLPTRVIREQQRCRV